MALAQIQDQVLVMQLLDVGEPINTLVGIQVGIVQGGLTLYQIIVIVVAIQTMVIAQNHMNLEMSIQMAI